MSSGFDLPKSHLGPPPAGYPAHVASPAASRATLLYDADCGFCTRAARAIARLDRGGQLTLAPIV